MFKPNSPKGGRNPKISNEQILNVIRESDMEEVSTTEIREDESITVSSQTLRDRLRSLESEGRVRSRKVGGNLVWELGELEPETPIQNKRISKSVRQSNLIYEIGLAFLRVALGLFAASVFLFITFLHSEAGQINPPLLSGDQIVFTAYFISYVGAGLAFLSGVFYAVSGIMPKISEWRVNRDEQDSD